MILKLTDVETKQPIWLVASRIVYFKPASDAWSVKEFGAHTLVLMTGRAVEVAETCEAIAAMFEAKED